MEKETKPVTIDGNVKFGMAIVGIIVSVAIAAAVVQTKLATVEKQHDQIFQEISDEGKRISEGMDKLGQIANDVSYMRGVQEARDRANSN